MTCSEPNSCSCCGYDENLVSRLESALALAERVVSAAITVHAGHVGKTYIGESELVAALNEFAYGKIKKGE